MKLSDRTKLKIKQNVVGYLYIAPVLLGIAIFTVLPIAYALLCSFFDMGIGIFTFDVKQLGNFVWFDNYIKNFTVTTYRFFFLQSLKVTFTYAVIYIPVTLVLSFSLAVLLNQKRKGMRIYRTLFYLPVLIPSVCSGMLWSRMTDPDYGVINALLENMGLPAMKWFTTASSSMPSLIFISLFGLGGNMILWLSQLKNIPQSVYESARLDGAGRVRQLFRITIPLCTPMILYNTIMGIIGVMQTYAQVITLTGGAGPSWSLYFYVMNIYENRVSHFGYSCALSFILFAIIAVLSFLTMKSSKWVYYAEEG